MEVKEFREIRPKGKIKALQTSKATLAGYNGGRIRRQSVTNKVLQEDLHGETHE